MTDEQLMSLLAQGVGPVEYTEAWQDSLRSLHATIARQNGDLARVAGELLAERRRLDFLIGHYVEFMALADGTWDADTDVSEDIGAQNGATAREALDKIIAIKEPTK